LKTPDKVLVNIVQFQNSTWASLSARKENFEQQLKKGSMR